jgi:hypothetical protein
MEQAWAEIQETGIPDFTTVACPDYKDCEADKHAIDWDLAFNEVEEGEKAKRDKIDKEQLLRIKQEQKKNEKLLKDQ